MYSKLSLALAVALLPALSFAAEPVQVNLVGKAPAPSVVVRYGDLDLSTRKGEQTLEARLKDAARKVCNEMLNRPVSIEGVRCQQELVDDAQQQVHVR